MPQRTYLEAISEALREEMRRDPTVLLLGEDIGVYGGAFKVTKGFLEEFGVERVVDTPISEAAIIGAAIGAALNGLRPVAEMQYIDFVTNGFNQLVNVAATIAYRWGIPVPLVVRGPAGGGVGSGPFHSRNPEAWFAHTPGLKVVYPAFPADAKGLLIAAIRDPNPVVFLEHKGLYRKVRQEVPSGAYALSLGKAAIVRSGRDVSVVAYGSAVHLALEVAQTLSAEGIEVEVVDLRTLVPLDEGTILESVRRTNRVVVVHEAPLTAGFGAEIVARITEKAFTALDAPVLRVAAADTPTPFAPPLEHAVLPSASQVEATIREVLRF
ncbi:MAG: alpha-ketoacid dehydrogenase subunit beta [Candidatus Kapabacteria bacterium]|nr:alpha-ketoacid dehydrogenase subunit beta [Candidatus Kapabacteria bacterium]MDW8011559.1 alpha-ketoacid dehydrogenase subunit beta [Bacteroidota bacterium]